jgi:uncharacterized lipoprotein YbaY
LIYGRAMLASCVRRLTVLTVIAIAPLAIALSGCAAEDNQPSAAPASTGGLAWHEKPRLLAPRGSDRRLLIGAVVNTANRTLRLDARDFQFSTADGTRVPGNAQFTSLPARFESGPSERDFGHRRASGRRISLPPGAATPVSLAWRQSAGADPPARVEYGYGALRLPPDLRPETPRPGEDLPWPGGAGRTQYDSGSAPGG